MNEKWNGMENDSNKKTIKDLQQLLYMSDRHLLYQSNSFCSKKKEMKLQILLSSDAAMM